MPKIMPNSSHASETVTTYVGYLWRKFSLFKAYILFLRSANGNFQNKYSFIDILFYFCEVRTEIFKKLIRKPEPKLLLTMA